MVLHFSILCQSLLAKKGLSWGPEAGFDGAPPLTSFLTPSHHYRHLCPASGLKGALAVFSRLRRAGSQGRTPPGAPGVRGARRSLHRLGRLPSGRGLLSRWLQQPSLSKGSMALNFQLLKTVVQKVPQYEKRAVSLRAGGFSSARYSSLVYPKAQWLWTFSCWRQWCRKFLNTRRGPSHFGPGASLPLVTAA